MMIALATSMPAVSNEYLHIAAPPPSVQPHNPACKGKVIGPTYMQAQVCRRLYENQTPNGAIGLTHITAQVKYPLVDNAPPWGKPDAYVLLSMEVVQGTNSLIRCDYSGEEINLKQGHTRICAKGADSNISSPVTLRVTWMHVMHEDGHIDTL